MFKLILLIGFGILYDNKETTADISHLTNGLFHHFYGPPAQLPAQPPAQLPVQPPTQLPPQPNPTLEPFIPEIIINRQLNNQQQVYHYNPPSHHHPHNYLPPPQAPPSLDDYEPTVSSTQLPFQDDDSSITFPIQPSPGYIPVGSAINSNSLSIQHEKPDFIINYYNNEGYDYNNPMKNPSNDVPPPLIGADVPFDGIDNQSDALLPPPSIDQGYNYENPIHSTYLPPVTFVRHAKDFDQFINHHAKQSPPIRLQLMKMRCIQNQLNNNGYLKAAFRLDNFIGNILPIIDNSGQIFNNNTRCELKLINSYLIINIAVVDFQYCGVRNCDDNHLCLRIRFPIIYNMKTASDSVLTLQCKIQDSVVSKLHSLKMGINNSLQERNAGTYAQGGAQQKFRTYIELLRKTSNGFTEQIQPKGIVQLGEELMLRAHVNAADGWNHTKLTDVNLQRYTLNGDIINSVNLITSAGCVNPLMRSICPLPPSFEPPLGHRFTFKAIMFQGMQNGDELVMTIKIAGCLEHVDCFVNTQSCQNNFISNRLRRSVMNVMSSENHTDLIEFSSISFRVQMPNENIHIQNKRHNDSDSDSSNDKDDTEYQLNEETFIFVISLGLISCLIFITLLLLYKFKYQ